MERKEKIGVVGLGKMDRHRCSRFCEREVSRLEPEVGAEGLDAIPGIAVPFHETA